MSPFWRFNMSFNRILVFLIIASALGGCATTGTPNGDRQQSARTSAVRAGESGAVKGCAGGAVVGMLRTGSLGGAVKGCLIGGAVVGVAVGVERYQEQTVAWRAFQQREQTAGAGVVLRTKTVSLQDRGQPKPTEVPESMTIQLNGADVHGRGAATIGLLKRTASLADASTVAITVEVSGTKAERAWIVGRLRDSLRANTAAIIREAPGRHPALVLTPAPVVGA
jgi:hypothetical protein